MDETTTTLPHYRAEDHTYWDGPSEMLGTTSALTAGLGLDTSFYTEESAYRGSYVHRAAHLLDLKNLSWDHLKPQYYGYLASYEALLQQWRPTWHLIEEPLFDTRRGYGGIPDRCGVLAGSPYEAIVDLKTPEACHREWALQMAGYGNLYALKTNQIARPFRRIAVRLRKDGTLPIINEFPIEQYFEDLATFYALLRVAQWKRKK